METEKIKTDLLRMLKDFMYGAPTNLEIFADKVINLFDSQFKQPPVSVMPSDEEIRLLCDRFARRDHPYNERMFDAIKEMFFSKEAPKEQIPEGWMYEDQLPEMTDEQYSEWFDKSKVIYGVRMGPKFPDDQERKICIEFGKFIEGYCDVYSDYRIEELFDLFKQRNK